ncbi:MAG: SDR family oxidoreductase [Saccharofermentanales bacterium]
MGYNNVAFTKDSVFLVTGGAGFIGSNLCEAILEKGYKVRCLDDLSTGKQRNVDLFAGNPDYVFIKGDVRDFDTCMSACADVDFVLHQAAWGSVPRSIEMPLLYEEINIRGTLNMMEAARRQKVRKFVYASSSSVYGDHPVLPKKEGQEGALLSPYALTKKVDEDYGRLYTSLYGLDTYGLRYFNVFGKRQDPDGAYAAVIPKFIKQLLNGERPVINGDGLQSRDFTYIENVIEANLKACLASNGAAGQAYNVAYGGRESLIGIYHNLNKALGTDVDPVFGPDRPGDIKHSNADISKARNMLGYNPDWSFERGIAAAIDWYRQDLGAK